MYNATNKTVQLQTKIKKSTYASNRVHLNYLYLYNYTEQCFTFEETDKKGGPLFVKKAENASTVYSGARGNTVLT